MEHLDSAVRLVVATPERVSFEYRLAGPGSRFAAQAIDLLIVAAGGMILVAAAVGLTLATGEGQLALLLFILASFVLLFGYFWFFEALWTGQTLGKRIMNLRAVGDRGEPLTFVQASVRNLVRVIDFIPFAYGLGLAVLFANGRGKRLGDLAAGTVVVREGAAITLDQLSRRAQAAGGRPPVADNTALRLLEPELRRFVVAYAERRPALPIPHREHLAQIARPALERAAREVVGAYGPLAGLDHLANQVDQAAAGVLAAGGGNPQEMPTPPRG